MEHPKVPYCRNFEKAELKEISRKYLVQSKTDEHSLTTERKPK
jgi:hypothetical protein